MEAPRPLRTSPFHPRQQELGAYFLEAAGWERPQWYEANAALLERPDIPSPNDWAARYWSPIVGAEAQATRERRRAVRHDGAQAASRSAGRGAAAFLQRLTTGRRRQVRRLGHLLPAARRATAGSAATSPSPASAATSSRSAPTATSTSTGSPGTRPSRRRRSSVRDITAGTCCVGLWGPRARRTRSQPLTDHRLLQRRACATSAASRAYVGTVPVTALRLSYVGELGWELYTTADLGLKLWDTLWAGRAAHGVIAAGRGAFNSLRLEKGYRSFGADMTLRARPVRGRARLRGDAWTRATSSAGRRSTARGEPARAG